LIDNITRAFEFFKIWDTILKDTPIAKGPGPQLVPLVEPIYTISEQLVDDLTTRVKHVILGD
jgi:hypothetical protein